MALEQFHPQSTKVHLPLNGRSDLPPHMLPKLQQSTCLPDLHGNDCAGHPLPLRGLLRRSRGCRAARSPHPYRRVGEVHLGTFAGAPCPSLCKLDCGLVPGAIGCIPRHALVCTVTLEQWVADSATINIGATHRPRF